jgi:carboxylate-amine ligase
MAPIPVQHPPLSGQQGAKGAARPSVLDHAFGDWPPLTVGVEEEYMLLDEAAFDLVSGVEPLLEAAGDGPYAEQLKPELMQCVLESGTVVCNDVPEAEADLRGIRRYASLLAREHGMRLGAAATHPFSLYEHQ